MNSFALKALLLSIITEMKFGMPIARNAGAAKKRFKELAGLPKGASNKTVLAALKRTYEENNLGQDFQETMVRMKADHLLTA